MSEQIVWVVIVNDEILAAFTSKDLAARSVELSIHKLTGETKELARNEMVIVPLKVRDSVDHL